MWENESEYKDYLITERRGYAWVLVKYGNRTEVEAIKEAEEFYNYEPKHKEFRGLIFHDEAWHWAMRKIFGERYWVSHPELEQPSVEYNDL